MIHVPHYISCVDCLFPSVCLAAAAAAGGDEVDVRLLTFL